LNRNRPIQVAYSVNAGHEYFVSLGEVGVRWALGENQRLSTLLEYEFGRENEADSALDGFPVVQDTVELQAAYQRKIGFLGVAYRRQVNDKFGLQVQADVSFADAEHMQTEVGISAQTAQITGFDEYALNSGYKGATVSLGLQYSADSPLIKDEGSASTYEASLGFRYEF